SEQQFGLLSFDRHKIQIDGEVSEWENTPIYQKENGELHKLYVDHDEGYLYIRLDYEPLTGASPMILFDVVPEQGNQFIEGKEEIGFHNGLDFIVDIKPGESNLLVDHYYDMYTYHYMYDLK